MLVRWIPHSGSVHFAGRPSEFELFSAGVILVLHIGLFCVEDEMGVGLFL